MDMVKKCKRVWGSNKRLHPEDTSSCGKYNKVSSEKHKQKDHKNIKNGCFSVYVGAERQRFVIKIKIANHPLFKELLDAAETEYGYRNDGPLCLPCDVDFFCEALAQMNHKHINASVSHSSSLLGFLTTTDPNIVVTSDRWDLGPGHKLEASDVHLGGGPP